MTFVSKPFRPSHTCECPLDPKKRWGWIVFDDHDPCSSSSCPAQLGQNVSQVSDANQIGFEPVVLWSYCHSKLVKDPSFGCFVHKCDDAGDPKMS